MTANAQSAETSQPQGAATLQSALILGCGGAIFLIGAALLGAWFIWAPPARTSAVAPAPSAPPGLSAIPSWVPVYPSAEIAAKPTVSGRGSYTFTLDNPTETDAILDYYRVELEGRGYVVKAYGIYRGQAQRAVTAQRQVIVAVREHPPGLTISLVYGPRERLSELSGE